LANNDLLRSNLILLTSNYGVKMSFIAEDSQIVTRQSLVNFVKQRFVLSDETSDKIAAYLDQKYAGIFQQHPAAETNHITA
jgi:hypothetical protein